MPLGFVHSLKVYLMWRLFQLGACADTFSGDGEEA